NEVNKYNILFIIPYYGKWPEWFPAFLLSCKANPDINWLIPTDCEIPEDSPNNVRFVSSTLNDLELKTKKVTGLNVKLIRPYKICDLKPAFGHIFQDEIKNYDFWGHCDMDVIFGKITDFITPDLLNNYDIITTRKNRIAGHFTLYRNNESINSLYTKHHEYEFVFESEDNFHYDENRMTDLIQSEISAGNNLRIYWPDFMLNYKVPREKPSIVPNVINKWRWSEGRLYEEGNEGGEIMYLHFMTWKDTLNKCFFEYSDNPSQFYISYTHIGEKKSIIPAEVLKIDFSKIFPRLFIQN
ncbi:hypothetical protein BIZ37_30015, partial [Photobacterium sp. BZF1]|uniref:DUF6625 family protein n=1 Tax=Photobacterium sp. BZF1 TaxID=1904457 RepID=UPI001653DD77